MADITLGTVTLPPDLQWADELTWVPLGASAKLSLSGAEIVQTSPTASAAMRQGSSAFAWVNYATVQALLALAAAPGATYTLTLLDGRTFTVRFRVEDTPIEATPVLHRATPDAAARDALQYIPIIRLKTV